MPDIAKDIQALTTFPRRFGDFGYLEAVPEMRTLA